MSYQNIFERMNRKEKRTFEKLSKEEKIKIFTSELNKTISSETQEQITNAVLVGYETACKLFAENYVIKYLQEEDKEKSIDILNELLAEIMKTYESIKKKEAKENKEEE